jgi:hypothetical protein
MIDFRGAAEDLNLARVTRLVEEGLAKLEAKEIPTPEARRAADELGLMFVATKDKVHLALKREVEETEGRGEGARIIDADHIIKAHREVAAFHAACMAIRALMEGHPDLVGEGIQWATKDPETGRFFAKAAFEGRTEELPTAIIPPLKMAASVMIVGTGNAKGIFWPRSVLFKEVPYDLSDIGEYTFKASSASFLRYGEQTVEQALQHMGFKGPLRRPVVEIFAPVPAPMMGAPAEEQFIPRGFIELKSFENGEYAVITILEGEAQADTVVLEAGSTMQVMGSREWSGAMMGQRTFLKFEFVPAMSEAREAETRSPQRGNIVVIAVPVKRMPNLFNIKDLGGGFSSKGWGGHGFDSPKTLGSGGGFDFSATRDLGGGGFLGSKGVMPTGAQIGSTHVERDRETATGMTLGESVSVTVDTSRQPGVFRIIPIGVSVQTEPSEVRATVINLADFRRKKQVQA